MNLPLMQWNSIVRFIVGHMTRKTILCSLDLQELVRTAHPLLTDLKEVTCLLAVVLIVIGLLDLLFGLQSKRMMCCTYVTASFILVI